MHCFQCVKGNKFESDSQLSQSLSKSDKNCFQCVKGNKFESDSQLVMCLSPRLIHCFQCVKGNKFESDSQRKPGLLIMIKNCFQCVKGNKFESDSQHFFDFKKLLLIFAQTERSGTLRSVRCGGSYCSLPLFFGEYFSYSAFFINKDLLFPMCQR